MEIVEGLVHGVGVRHLALHDVQNQARRAVAHRAGAAEEEEVVGAPTGGGAEVVLARGRAGDLAGSAKNQRRLPRRFAQIADLVGVRRLLRAVAEEILVAKMP